MLAAYVEPILIITGLATAGALALVVAPAMMMKLVFGQCPHDPLNIFIARHWALLVFLVGFLLVWAAFHPEVRVPALIVAVVEKAVFVVGMLASPLRRRPAVMVIAAADAAMTVVYMLMLAGM